MTKAISLSSGHFQDDITLNVVKKKFGKDSSDYGWMSFGSRPNTPVSHALVKITDDYGVAAMVIVGPLDDYLSKLQTANNLTYKELGSFAIAARLSVPGPSSLTYPVGRFIDDLKQYDSTITPPESSGNYECVVAGGWITAIDLEPYEDLWSHVERYYRTDAPGKECSIDEKRLYAAIAPFVYYQWITEYQVIFAINGKTTIIGKHAGWSCNGLATMATGNKEEVVGTRGPGRDATPTKFYQFT